MVSHGNSSYEEELNSLRDRLPETVKETVSSKSVTQITYTIDLAKRIIDEYIQGTSLHAISAQGEMPSYSTLIRWSKEHPEFSKMLRSVREARALHFEDKVIETAENACGKDADRIKVDVYKWAAEVNDPEVYGKKIKHSGDANNPIAIQVITGFGPPNAWQTPPELNADGTIKKTDIEIKDVKSEVINADPGDTRTIGEDSGTGNAPREETGSESA